MAEDIITSADTATDHEYDGSEIQVLKGLEAVRKRPGMYIGSTGARGLHHLVYEIVDNSIDEALAGHCDHIEVKIKKGDIIEVTDNGRGIPVGIQPDTGLPAVTVVFTILHAGGKFGGENSGYKVSGGLHGVGASVVNALSEWLEVRVHKNGNIYQMRFSRGNITQPMTIVGTKTSDKTVTTRTEVIETYTPQRIEKKDNSMMVGQSRVEVSGIPGYSTRTYKIITENGQTTEELANTSNYIKRDEVVYVGTIQPKAETPSSEPDTSSETQQEEPAGQAEDADS